MAQPPTAEKGLNNDLRTIAADLEEALGSAKETHSELQALAVWLEAEEQRKAEARTPQVYLELYHGRTSPDQDMDDWGSQGPTLGPFDEIHVTYCSHIRCMNGKEETVIPYVDDLLHYEDMYYGDWTVTATPDAQTEEHRS